MMKKLFLGSVFVLAMGLNSAATPPSDILFSFDVPTHMVRVDILHETRNPKEHFIYNIVVSVNGKKAITQTTTEQTSAEKQSLAWVIPGLKAGDKVSVDADCNKYGDLTKEAIVKDNPVVKEKQKI
jgi:hypothetical protein